MKRVVFTAAAAAALALPASATLADITVGTKSNGNCIPFGCFGAYTGIEYQQIYRAGNFSSPIDISSITFFNDDGATVEADSYSIEFYLTGKNIPDVSTDLASNRGALLVDFGSFTLRGKLPHEVTFDGNDFLYDPSAGNLLMDVTLTNFDPRVPSGGYFAFSHDPGKMYRIYTSTEHILNIEGGGLVTRFNEAEATVPEPATWATMVVGFGTMGCCLRRRKLVRAKASRRFATSFQLASKRPRRPFAGQRPIGR